MLPTIEEIGKMRKNLGISQKELARTCGVSQSYIARMEKGSINPTYDKIRKIYDYLSVFSKKAESFDLIASKIMSKSVITCHLNDPIISALNTMREKGYSQLPVVNGENKIMGTITEADVNEILLKGTPIESLKNLSVRKVMGPSLPQMPMNTPVSVIYPILRFSNAVLVMDGGELKGIISKADILKAVELYGERPL
ncbi:MAG: transcriptional regulatory protein [Thermoplasmatales archaeon E-plasma]|jgi:predicted transcriptional regulator|nr:MAG: transcriptional regulatory protein [Thermoplasmatales archaeon E-plasma]MCL4347911.1 CBS domain-containing protein [Candidatus Thermoplasmatota archaeon]MCL5787573.1 CBS domain-containing protein [Candidatus Thermoplasmatota archaeon]